MPPLHEIAAKATTETDDTDETRLKIARFSHVDRAAAETGRIAKVSASDRVERDALERPSRRRNKNDDDDNDRKTPVALGALDNDDAPLLREEEERAPRRSRPRLVVPADGGRRKDARFTIYGGNLFDLFDDDLFDDESDDEDAD